MARLAEMFNVNHFIVSQVNPHVIPFLAKEEDFIAAQVHNEGSSQPGWVYTMMNLAKAEAVHRMHVVAEMGIFPNALTKARSVLIQKYSGDITIFPEISYTDFPRMLKNPTTDFILQAMLSGERATWPKMSRIRNHCAIELALDDAVQQLRARVVFSPSQIDLRLNTFTNVLDNGPKPGKESDTRMNRGRRIRRGASRTRDRDGRLFTSSSTEQSRITQQNKIRTSFLKPPSLTVTVPQPPDLVSSSSDSPQSSPSSPDGYVLDSSSPSSPTSPSYFSSFSNTTRSSKSKQLFPHASQPCTPLIGSSRNSRSVSRSRHGFNRHWHIASPPPEQTRSPSPSSSISQREKGFQAGLAMTPSVPEAKYKRIFHGRH